MCPYWCPLARMMQMFNTFFTHFRVSRFAIPANEKCIACGECSRNCQVGINVMNYAMKQEELNNFNSSCIGCGICVTVCPMDALSFGGRMTGWFRLREMGKGSLMRSRRSCRLSGKRGLAGEIACPT